MNHKENLGFFLVLVVGVALVAADNAIVTMERDGDRKLDELMEDDQLLFVTKPRRIHKLQERPSQDVTTAPPPIPTEHPLHVEERHLLQDENLLPTFRNMSRWYQNEKGRLFDQVTYSNQVHQLTVTTPPLGVEEIDAFEEDDLLPVDLHFDLSRDRRSVGSGDSVVEVTARITLSEPFAVSIANEIRRRNQVATQLRRFFVVDFDVGVETVNVLSIEDDGDGNSIYNFTVTFDGPSDLRGVSYALERLWRSETLIGEYTIIISPTICNSVDVFVNVICVLCDPNRPCVNGVCGEFLEQSSVDPAAFGISEADIRLARQDDVISSQVEIPDGMPFFNERVTKLYVGDNGGVSLNSPYNPYGLENIQSALKNYLCIYCDDFDNRSPTSNVWYQAYPAGKVWATNMLGRVTAEVRAHTEYTRFKASWACVITWKDIPEYLSSSGTMGNSFQMILVKDGMRTFLLFYFIEIKATRFFREQAVHGYKRQGSSRDVYEMLYSRRTLNSNQAVFEKPNMQFVKGNTGFVGKWIFKIGEIVVPNYPAMCFDWYLQNRPFRSNFRLRAQIMGINTCPCWRNVFMFTAAFLPTPALTNQARFCSEMQAWFGLDTYECCYDAFGRFISQYPEAGGYHRYSSLIDPARHKLQDSDPRDWCCVKSNLCRLYEDVRPVSRCWWNRPILIIIFIVGDPHFVTLDGKKFTYNGIGETRLVELEPADKSFTFKLQCRTAQALSDSGEKVNASIFSAFAAEQQSDTLGSGKIHVQLNKQRTKMVIYFNDLDVTNDFYSDENFVRRQNNVTASRKNETRIDFSFTSTGIVVAVRFSSGTLAQGVVIPEKYKGMTTGLLGNYNGDDTDDFKSPDGRSYSADSTDKQLYLFGKSWAVPDDGSSVMHYAPGESTKTFTDDKFIPLYTEDFTPEQRAAAVSVCGADNEQCIYDYMVTQNNALATFTKSQIQDTQDNAKILANRAPSLTGTTHLNVEVGKIASFTFIGNDADNDQVSYITVDSPTSGFTFDQSSGNGTFIPPNTNLVKLRVAAKDTKEAQSSVLSVKIRLCPGCGANGNCDYNTPVAAVTSESDSYFQIVSCICNTGYTGADCSEDKNGCDGNPCGIGRTCTDNDPTYEETSGKPYNCSACMPGYKEATGSSKCENVDECATNNGNCPANSNCTDQPGSYKCTCNAGFRQNSAGTCDDIDECLEHLSDCKHTCTNSAGGFICGCHTGFTLNADGKQCDASNVPASCPSTCSLATEICASNGSGDPICLCKAGYEKKTGATQCTDIDECSLSLCAQGCTNSVGSYTCSCFTGFTLGPDKLDCLRCSFPKWGDDCSSTCECQGRASACDPVQGCVCFPGWTGSNCSTDVNECTANPDICGSNSVCTNNDGSYTCTCNSGFVKNGTECMDLNECEADSDTTLCPSKSVCMNVLGNYTCTCNAGYTKTGVVCIDVDECATGQAACEHNCLNKDGSYNCYCNAGYTLNDDRKTCSKDPDQVDPCADLTNKVCGHYCEAVNKQAVCRCKRGYYLADDNITCSDVDECGSSTLNLCTDKSKCSNTPGSYTCGCPVGQKLKNDGRTCADCDAFHWGVNCSSECTCSDLGTESCDRIKGCVCKPGWTGPNCNLDVDECSSQVTCPANADCDNTPGSYRCVCRTGYRKSADQSTCDEINECASSSDNVCDHDCHDTIGSYYCTCKSGFILEGKGTCKDIDECSTNSHDCQQVCRNTIGSFTCTCRDGFEFADSTRKTCTPVAGRSSCSKTCNVTNGGCLDPTNDTCFCNSGYQLNADGFTCDDIDECKPNSSCSVNCTNTAGSFICSCNPGQKLAADKITCEACEPGKWGLNCANTCTCDTSNSVSCNAVDGTCTCREGWEGTTCTDDIPECTNTLTICGNNGICNEKDGSYSCTCTAGYIRSNDACTPCTTTTWGDNCANTCTCDFGKSESCDSVTGKCTCKAGWTGTNCTDDVNECTNTASPVCTNDHENCKNTQGSFVCGCTSGYQRSADNSGCIDLNECLTSSLNKCTFQCDNNVGSFSCSCPAGYIGSGNNCEANFVGYEILITLDTDKSAIVSDKSSDAYKKLQDDISAAIDAIIKPEVGEAHLKTVMGTLTTGSVIAPAELRVDKSKTDNELGLLAKSLEELAEIRSLDIDGTSTPVTNITFKGIPIIKNHTVCDVYKIVRAFGNDEICEVDADGIPIHRKLSEEGTNIPLIVGVSMASLILLILVLLLLLYFCCYRRRSKRAPSEERDNRAFQSAFVGSVPTKGFFGASRYMMYSPHTLSSAASQASEDSSGRRPRKFNTNDSGLPRWNSSPDLTRRVPDDIDRNDAASNFSWGNLFTRLGQFEVPRPTVNTTRNKFFDSNA